MSTLKTLNEEHLEVFKKIQLIETVQIRSLRKTLDEYPEFVKEFSKFVKTVLLYHFKVEEEALFPALKKIIEPLVIKNLLFDHENIVRVFREYLEHVKDFDLSIQILKQLLNYLDIHAQKEERLFSSVILSDEELKKIDEMAKLVKL